MLDQYLYSTNGVVDRLVAAQGHDLRSCKVESNCIRGGKDKDTKVEVAVSKLEKEMDKLTDPNILRGAREHQQGVKCSNCGLCCIQRSLETGITDGTRSYIEKIDF